jgi:FtsP/CotA-like multicopper oxidase with cupredoxin domain
MKNSVLICAAATVALVLGSLPTGAQVDPPAQICSAPDNSMTLFAEEMKNGRVGYGLSPKEPTIPGPTIEMVEGECVAITLVNDTTEKVSLHTHGVLYTPASDASPVNSSCVGPGRSLTYLFKATASSPRADGTTDPGTAGYWHYHDHCMGSPHGSGGIRAGLFGALIVRRPGDPLPDRGPFVLTMGPGVTINRKKAPSTPVLRANQGERVEFVVIGEGDLMHTFHLHAHRWADTRTGLLLGPNNDIPIVDNITVGPADSFGFQIVAGEGVGPGAWMYHCHMQNHADLGMSGVFLVRTPEGEVTPQSAAALRRWRRLESGGHHH